jgi:type II secretory pathway pseudopilin PulG
LTLIELVLVVAVLAILAGFIVPRLGFIRNLAGDSGNATIISDAVQQSVLYNTAEGHYPTGEDTLLNSAGTGLDAYLNGTLTKVLTTVTLDTGAYSSLTGQFGTTTVNLYNQSDVATTTPNLDDNTITTLASTSVLAEVNTATTQGENVYRAAYESAELTVDATGTLGTPNDGTYLVALGYGTNSQINGRTGLEPPVLFDKTPGQYTRPILLLKVYGSASTSPTVPPGSSAATSIAIGYDGSTVTSSLTKYAVDQNR